MSRFIRILVSTLLIVLCGLVLIFIINDSQYTKLLSIAGLMTGMSCIFIYNFLLDKKEDYIISKENKMLSEQLEAWEKVNQILDQTYGYREALAKDNKLYAQMLENGAGVAMANSIAHFAKEVKQTDTIVLAKIEHETNKWFLNMAGCPIYESTAKWFFDKLREKTEEWASYNGMIRKEKKVVN